MKSHRLTTREQCHHRHHISRSLVACLASAITGITFPALLRRVWPVPSQVSYLPPSCSVFCQCHHRYHILRSLAACLACAITGITFSSLLRRVSPVPSHSIKPCIFRSLAVRLVAGRVSLQVSQEEI